MGPSATTYIACKHAHMSYRETPDPGERLLLLNIIGIHHILLHKLAKMER
jgi:hypothetical protein